MAASSDASSAGSGGSEAQTPRPMPEVLDDAIGSRDLAEVRAAVELAKQHRSPLVGRLEALERTLAEDETGIGAQFGGTHTTAIIPVPLLCARFLRLPCSPAC